VMELSSAVLQVVAETGVDSTSVRQTGLP